jgi:hypothetical protein
MANNIKICKTIQLKVLKLYHFKQAEPQVKNYKIMICDKRINGGSEHINWGCLFRNGSSIS